MGMKELTREAVEAVIAEYDQIGRDALLQRYGFSDAQAPAFEYEGQSYDSRAVIAAAWRHLGPGEAPFDPDEAARDERTVARALKQLGFDISGTRAFFAATAGEFLAVPTYFPGPRATCHSRQPGPFRR